MCVPVARLDSTHLACPGDTNSLMSIATTILFQLFESIAVGVLHAPALYVRSMCGWQIQISQPVLRRLIDYIDQRDILSVVVTYCMKDSKCITAEM